MLLSLSMVVTGRDSKDKKLPDLLSGEAVGHGYCTLRIAFAITSVSWPTLKFARK